MEAQQNFPHTYAELINVIMHIFVYETNVSKEKIKQLGDGIIQRFNRKIQQQIYSLVPPIVASDQFNLSRAPDIINDYDYFRRIVSSLILEQRLVNIYVLHQTFEELTTERNIMIINYQNESQQTEETLKRSYIRVNTDTTERIKRIPINI
jgi:hypothetical protein